MENQNVWAVSRRNGIFEIDRQGKVINAIKPNELPGDIDLLYFCSKDNEGNLWLAGKNNRSPGLKLLKTTPGSDDFKLLTIIPDESKSIHFLQNGRVLIAGYDGIWELDKQSFASHKPKEFENTEIATIYNIHESTDGALYISVNSERLDIYELNDSIYVEIKQISGNGNCYGLIESTNGQSIYGATSYGLIKIDSESKDLTAIPHLGKMPISQSLFGIEMDGEGKIWLKTRDGLLSYEEKQNRVRGFNQYDGVQEAMNNVVFLTDDNGRIWVSGHKGVNYFEPGFKEP